MNHRTPRLLGALTLAATLVGLALAGPVSAAPAPLVFRVDNLQGNVTLGNDGVVTQGQLGAFHVLAQNPSDNTSNISQLYLTERSGASVFAITGDDRGACTTSGQLLCDFGALRPGDTIEFTVALVAPTTDTTWHVDFEFSSTGYVLGKKKINQSHGDLFFQLYDISSPAASDTVDSAGTYVWDANHQSVSNGLSLGNTNKQSTSITVVGTGFPASVADGSTLTFTCDSTTHCPGTFFGQVSEVDVDNGADHLIHVVIQLYKPGKSPNQVNGVYHQWTTGTGTPTDPFVLHEENITTVCGPTPVPSCFNVTKVGSQNLQLDVYVPHNGKYGGF